MHDPQQRASSEASSTELKAIMKSTLLSSAQIFKQILKVSFYDCQSILLPSCLIKNKKKRRNSNESSVWCFVSFYGRH